MCDFNSWHSGKKEAVEALMREALQSQTQAPVELVEAMAYAVFPGGKRLRALLVMAAAEALNQPAAAVLPLAAALEFIHCYSLVHDDLPCMDNDAYRRGRLSCHKKYGEAMALLAGNALFSLAFEMLAGDSSRSYNTVTTIRYLLQASGAQGMIGGQAFELTLRPPVTEDRILTLHRMKTVALIKSAVILPAVWFGSPQSEFTVLETYGDKLGLAFQIIDDLNDAPVKSEPANYAVISGVAPASRLAGTLIAEAVESLSSLPGTIMPLRAIADLTGKNLT